ncbi:unnamed protein product [Discula destructiva]
MSLGSWSRARGKMDLVQARSVFVNVQPTPTSLSERRAVLHALQRHGTVEVFKRLPSTGSFICAFQKRDKELTNLLNMSPLTIKYVREPLDLPSPRNDSPGFKPASVAAPIEIHQAEPDATPSEQTFPTQESDPIKTFKIWLQLTGSRYNHKTKIRWNPIHGRWPAVQRDEQDFVYYALREVVPDNIAHHGLCDWVAGKQLSEDAKLARGDEEVAADWQVAERLERRRNRESLQADDYELVSWTSVSRRLRSADDNMAERSAETPEGESFGESALDYGSESVSEPLRGEAHPLASRQNDASELELLHSDTTAAELVDQIDDGHDALTNSTSKRTVQKILDMSASSKAAPSPEFSPEASRSEQDDQNKSASTPIDETKET